MSGALTTASDRLYKKIVTILLPFTFMTGCSLNVFFKA
jgi:hypothetical protein